MEQLATGGAEMAKQQLHPQVVAWLQEIELAPGPEVARGLLSAGFGHSPDAFAELSLPHFHLVLGLEDFHQRRRLHSLLLRINRKIAAPSATSSSTSSSPYVPPSSLASPRRPHLPSHTTSLPSPRSSSSSFSSSSTSPSTTSLPPVPRHYAPSKVKSFDSALGSRSGHQHDDLDWGDEALPSPSGGEDDVDGAVEEEEEVVVEEEVALDGGEEAVVITLGDEEEEDEAAADGGEEACAPKPRSRSFGSSSSSSQTQQSGASRPLLEKEVRSRERDIVFTGKRPSTLEVHEPKVKVDMSKYTDVHTFAFDHYFSDLDDNLKIYEEAVRPLVSTIFKGGARVTCFCYGQTGSGKTHTMMGKRGEDGLYAMAAKDIFGMLDEASRSRPLRVSVALFEIYGNKLFDLLNDKKPLVARQNSKQQVCVVGLKERLVSNADELLGLISKGSASRSTSATGVHAESSRSHAILQISLKNAEGKTRGMFSFIDLAGSEKAGDTNENSRQTRIEGAEINKSLLALKECIRALDRSQKHAPFRQSTLTQVLKDSFMGPHSRTIMIANIAPNSGYAEHTLNTLRYADRVRELRGHNPSFSSPPPASSPTTPQGGGLGPRQRSTDGAPATTSPSGGGGGDDEILRWHRHHLEELTRLVDEELQLLEKVDRGEITGARYRAALNDILIDEAMLFANMPKNLE
ncbi:kinesin motor domain containing protein [Acanthamoeba castellanii str. Neff]|uniref:Kinesin-like protein n=1 Tax=Acanthamoeba castellanii (strain ATCC 30010 / Neff) TaxID=1257118 RepID=L8GJT9_ACACF|nr:kinesin motor domain containing protein [Acanthamoeba castellanii str. Neff]ELR12998.1 kinesin motor domain containing protein [Acanthamoeba castellanii str. Neff]